MKDRQIIGFGGSPRKSGNTDVILDRIITGARSLKVDAEKIYLRDYSVSPCVGCERCRKDKICTKIFDGMQLIYPRILGSRGLILGSPTHNYNVTSWVKAFIDRLYCFYDFTDDRPRAYSSRLADQRRKAVVFAICEQPDIREMGFTIEAMTMPLEALGYEIIDTLAVTSIFDRGAVKKNREVMDAAYEKGRILAQALI